MVLNLGCSFGGSPQEYRDGSYPVIGELSGLLEHTGPKAPTNHNIPYWCLFLLIKVLLEFLSYFDLVGLDVGVFNHDAFGLLYEVLQLLGTHVGRLYYVLELQ